MSDVIRIREIATACGHCFGVASLNAPASLNALSLAMVDVLQSQLTQWATNPAVIGVLLEGEGERAFCAGGDLRDLYQSIRDCGDAPNPYARQFFSREYRLDYLIHTYPKPLLCWGNGIVMGGGIGLMAGASHRVVTERTRLAMPEIAIGLFPDVGGSWFLNRLPGRIGLFLALTGAPLNAADALFTGLADFYLPHDGRDKLLDAITQAGWQQDAQADAHQLSHLIESQSPADARGEAALPAPSMLRNHFDQIQALMGHDALADIAARLAVAAVGDSWLAKAAANFGRGSPTSAVLAMALLQQARHLSLREVFQLELDVAIGCCANHDFAEGIRALLVDKDRKPQWKPARIADVGAALIADHFRSRYRGENPLSDLR